MYKSELMITSDPLKKEEIELHMFHTVCDTAPPWKIQTKWPKIITKVAKQLQLIHQPRSSNETIKNV
jgi:hypothetical protein